MTNYTKSTNFASKDSLAVGNPLKIVKGTEIDTEFNNIALASATKADLTSPMFVGSPSRNANPPQDDSSFQLATTNWVQNELATEVIAINAAKAPKESPTFTGVPAAPTAAVDTDTTQLATTAFVVAQAATVAPLANGTAAIGTSKKYARQDHVRVRRERWMEAGYAGLPERGVRHEGSGERGQHEAVLRAVCPRVHHGL